jgi:Ca-activated chloride channel family protein
MFWNYEYVNPEYFWLFILLPLVILWYFFKRKKQVATLHMSSLKGFQDNTILSKLKPLLLFLRLVTISAVIVALARPRTVDVSSRTKTNKGIDIVMAIDISASMLAKDLKPNRLDALKDVASKFIKGRPSDRIGLVLYAGESYTKTPITSDKSIVLGSLKEVKYDSRVSGGTAIGMGLATSVNRLKDSKAKSKVIILLTDGVNNSGTIDPKIASELALNFGIKVYTIGLGTNGRALSPVGLRPNGSFVFDRVKVEIDEVLLKEIAKVTGGEYFRATNNKKLQEIYAEINKLEKTEVEEFKFYNYDEKFRFFALIGLGIFLLELLLRFTVFRSFI